jgi:hypothetical protein
MELKMGEQIRNNRRVMGVAAGVVLAVAIVLILMQVLAGGSGQEAETQAWFYDLNTGQLFVTTRDELSPIGAPSGPRPTGEPAGALARVFSCHECNAKNRYIGWLEIYTPQGHENLEGTPLYPPDVLANLAGNEKLIAAPPESAGDAVEWHGYNTPQAQRIRERARQRCDDGEATECLP